MVLAWNRVGSRDNLQGPEPVTPGLLQVTQEQWHYRIAQANDFLVCGMVVADAARRVMGNLFVPRVRQPLEALLEALPRRRQSGVACRNGSHALVSCVRPGFQY